MTDEFKALFDKFNIDYINGNIKNIPINAINNLFIFFIKFFSYLRIAGYIAHGHGLAQRPQVQARAAHQQRHQNGGTVGDGGVVASDSDRRYVSR